MIRGLFNLGYDLVSACSSSRQVNNSANKSKAVHLFVSGLMLLGTLSPALPAFAQGVIGTLPVQIFYVPFPETQVLSALETIVPPK